MVEVDCTCQTLLEKNREVERLKIRVDRIEERYRNLTTDFKNHRINDILDDVTIVKDTLQKPVREIIEEYLEEKEKWG